MSEIPNIDLAWEAVNALGGAFDPKDIEGRGFCTAISKALTEIERFGGKDPLPQRAFNRRMAAVRAMT